MFLTIILVEISFFENWVSKTSCTINWALWEDFFFVIKTQNFVIMSYIGIDKTWVFT